MEGNTVIVKQNAGVTEVKLNRPAVLNSFNVEMASELIQALENFKQDASERALLLSAEGKAFCAGQDLAEVAGSAGDLGKIVRERYNKIIALIRGIEKPIVVAVNGIAAGAGANLALACDFVIAAKEASFVQSFSKIGLIPDSGGTFMLPRLIGLARATSLCMLAEKLSAEEAQRIGLIYKVTEFAELHAESIALAQKLSLMPTRGLGLTKKLFNSSFEHTLDRQLTLEAEAQAEAGRTADYHEGVGAFLQKRAPVFKGN